MTLSKNRTLNNDWKYTISIVAIMKELITVHFWTENFFFKSFPLIPIPLLQQPTENFVTVTSK